MKITAKGSYRKRSRSSNTWEIYNQWRCNKSQEDKRILAKVKVDIHGKRGIDEMWIKQRTEENNKHFDMKCGLIGSRVVDNEEEGF